MLVSNGWCQVHTVPYPITFIWRLVNSGCFRHFTPKRVQKAGGVRLLTRVHYKHVYMHKVASVGSICYIWMQSTAISIHYNNFFYFFNVCGCSSYKLLYTQFSLLLKLPNFVKKMLVHGQVTIIFVVSVCLCVCLFVQSFSQPSLIRFRSN